MKYLPKTQRLIFKLVILRDLRMMLEISQQPLAEKGPTPGVDGHGGSSHPGQQEAPGLARVSMSSLHACMSWVREAVPTGSLPARNPTHHRALHDRHGSFAGVAGSHPLA